MERLRLRDLMNALIVIGVVLVATFLVIGRANLLIARGAITVVRPERRLIRQLGPIIFASLPHEGDAVFVHFDLPGIDPNTIDLTVEQNVLSVSAERLYDRNEGDQIIAKERPVARVRAADLPRRAS